MGATGGRAESFERPFLINLAHLPLMTLGVFEIHDGGLSI